MKTIISATQYNEVYSDSTGILITKHISSDVDYLNNKVKILLAENDKLKECVVFYADYRNHGSPGDAEISDYEKDKLSFFKQGKRARQVLKELYESNT